ncbi:hypothetical protein [Acidilobus sp.]|uniref:hypothetical protein n=1 Tax=Acidilobus sp. TaxID=1872109 RepID=UPI003D039997
MGRRSLSEVIGAFIVLGVVLLAAISLVRMGSEIVGYSERVSSQLFQRAAEEATPPKLELLVNGSRLYLMVSPNSPLNISYAIVEASGNVFIEKVNRLVSSSEALPLPGNYSACQNVSVYLVTSSGAVFTYSASSDPLIAKACGWNTSAAGGGYQATGPSQAYLGPDSYPAALDMVYISGLDGGNSTLEYLGEVNVTVHLAGKLLNYINVVVTSGGRSLSGTVSPSAGDYVTLLGYINVSGQNLAVAAYDIPSRGVVGIAIGGPGDLVNYTGHVSVRGFISNPYTTILSTVLASLVGYSGNFTSKWFIGNPIINTTYYYRYNSTATGYGSTLGPINLAYYVMFYHDPLILWPTTINLNASLSLRIYHAAGESYVNLSLPSPLSLYSVPVYTNASERTYVAEELMAMYGPFKVTFQTGLGEASEYFGNGTFLIQSSSIYVESPEMVMMPITSNLTFNYTNYGSYVSGAAWARRVFYMEPLAYLLEVNDSSYSVFLTPPTYRSRPVLVNGLTEPGPVLAVIPGANVTLPCPGLLFPAQVKGLSVSLGSPLAVGRSLPQLQSGLYLYVCPDQEYWLVYS